MNASKSLELLVNFGNGSVPELASVKRQKVVKILVVLFDERLSFEEHISEMCKKANAKLFLILRLKRLGFSDHELSMLYNALVLSALTYCCSAWGGASQGLLRKVDIIQRKAVRLGIISSFIPITTIIRNSDERLYQKIIDVGEDHVLFNTLPKRTVYAASKLRSKLPPVVKSKSEKELSIFPHRLLRLMNH